MRAPFEWLPVFYYLVTERVSGPKNWSEKPTQLRYNLGRGGSIPLVESVKPVPHSEAPAGASC